MEGGGPQRIVIQGLHEAVLRAATIVGPRIVAVGSVRVSDSAAMVALLEKEVLSQEWKIEHRHRLTRLARLDHDLSIVLDAIFPILIDAPFDLDAGRQLRRYGWSVQHMAFSISGPDHPLYDAAGPVGRFLRRRACHQDQSTRGAAWLAGNIWEVRDRVAALRTFLVQFPVPEDGDIGDAAAGDDDDGPELPEDDIGTGGGLERIVIQGLREAVLRTGTIVGPRLVAVGSVRVRDTAAMVALLKKEVLRQEWVVEHRHRLTRLTRLDHDLRIILDAIVPILVDTPFDLDACRQLRRYGWSLQHLARSIFGPVCALYDAASPVGGFLRRHARHQHQGTRDAAWLARNILEVRDKVSALKTFLVEFPEDEGDVGGAAGDGDDGRDSDDEYRARHRESGQDSGTPPQVKLCVPDQATSNYSPPVWFLP